MKTTCTLCNVIMIINEPKSEAYQTDGKGKVYCVNCSPPSIKKKENTSQSITINEEVTKKSFWSRLLGK